MPSKSHKLTARAWRLQSGKSPAAASPLCFAREVPGLSHDQREVLASVADTLLFEHLLSSRVSCCDVKALVLDAETWTFLMCVMCYRDCAVLCLLNKGGGRAGASAPKEAHSPPCDSTHPAYGCPGAHLGGNFRDLEAGQYFDCDLCGCCLPMAHTCMPHIAGRSFFTVVL
eukprot:1627677-Amphidinium_carterae.4